MIRSVRQRRNKGKIFPIYFFFFDKKSVKYRKLCYTKWEKNRRKKYKRKEGYQNGKRANSTGSEGYFNQ